MAWRAKALRATVHALVATALVAPGVTQATGWSARIDVEGVVDGARRRVTPLTIGAATDATDNFDRGTDLLAPPPPPGERLAEAYIHCPNARPFYRRLNTDMRDLSRHDPAPFSWEVVVTNPTGALWTMSWVVSAIPAEWPHVRLTSPGGYIDMRDDASASVPAFGSHTYTVVVSRDALPEAPGDDSPARATLEAASVNLGEPPPIAPPIAPPSPAEEVAPENTPREATEQPDGEDTAAPEAAPQVTEAPRVSVARTLGDATGDGVVTIDDVVTVARRVGAEATEGDPADVDHDGVVTIRDLVRVVAAMRTPSAAPSRRALAGSVARLTSGEIVAEEFVREIVSAPLARGARLLPNYPDPFNPETWIPFELETAGTLSLTVYDLSGAAVRRLYLGYRESGSYRSPSRAAYWDGRVDLGEAAGSGSYVVALRVNGEAYRRRITIRK